MEPEVCAAEKRILFQTIKGLQQQTIIKEVLNTMWLIVAIIVIVLICKILNSVFGDLFKILFSYGGINSIMCGIAVGFCFWVYILKENSDRTWIAVALGIAVGALFKFLFNSFNTQIISAILHVIAFAIDTYLGGIFVSLFLPHRSKTVIFIVTGIIMATISFADYSNGEFE